MVYNYLLDLYQVLAERKKEIERLGDTSSPSSEDEQYNQGRILVLDDFTAFLRKNYHAKLPRRMQKN
jgi:hypothetical protein